MPNMVFFGSYDLLRVGLRLVLPRTWKPDKTGYEKILDVKMTSYLLFVMEF